MRSLYTVLIYLATPLVLLYLFLRGLRSAAYLKRWRERFGWFPRPPLTGGVLIHAASMGEVNATGPLVRELARRLPHEYLCFTTLTPTGSERVRALFGDAVFHVYAPLDLPGAVRRFLDRVRPRLMVIMETELWPNLYHAAAERGIPIVIANARISPRSVSRYRRLPRLTGATLDKATRIGAQSPDDAARLVAIGGDAGRIEVTGNMKFDLDLPASLIEQGEAVRAAWGAHRPVLLAGSTHEGDERPVLDAFSRVLRSFPQALLVLVPRHPERFGRAAQLARSAGLSVSLRSKGIGCPPEAQCYLVDTMGELQRFYAACDVAFVGGSFEAIGGHNMLEPAALSKPILVGPHTFNFADITEQLLACGGALRVADDRAFGAAVERLFADPELRDRMGRAARALVREGQGAVHRTAVIIEELLSAAAGSPPAGPRHPADPRRS